MLGAPAGQEWTCLRYCWFGQHMHTPMALAYILHTLPSPRTSAPADAGPHDPDLHRAIASDELMQHVAKPATRPLVRQGLAQLLERQVMLVVHEGPQQIQQGLVVHPALLQLVVVGIPCLLLFMCLVYQQRGFVRLLWLLLLLLLMMLSSCLLLCR